MSNILVLFSTHDGQTEGIAERIGFRLSKLGYQVTVRSASAPDAVKALRECDGVIVGGSLRFGRFDSRLVAFVRENLDALFARPSAFFSVSMSAAKDTSSAVECMTAFEADTGWIPDDSAAFAGALRYTRYSRLVRMMMSLISRANGGETDTTRDYEYTDWKAVDRFAAGFALRVVTPLAA